MTKDKPPTTEIVKGSKEHLGYIFGILAENLDKDEYAHVVAVMQMLFIGHDFYCSPDGFELVNMSIRAKEFVKKKETKSKIKSRQDNVIHIKP